MRTTNMIKKDMATNLQIVEHLGLPSLADLQIEYARQADNSLAINFHPDKRGEIGDLLAKRESLDIEYRQLEDELWAHTHKLEIAKRYSYKVACMLINVITLNHIHLIH